MLRTERERLEVVDRGLHFGLGPSDRVDLVQVRWPDGTTDEWKDVTADQVLRVEQGKR